MAIYPNASLPIKIHDRILLFQSDKMLVLQGAKIILEQEIAAPALGDYDLHASDDEIKICDGGEENWHLIYSYKHNKFKIREAVERE